MSQWCAKGTLVSNVCWKDKFILYLYLLYVRYFLWITDNGVRYSPKVMNIFMWCRSNMFMRLMNCKEHIVQKNTCSGCNISNLLQKCWNRSHDICSHAQCRPSRIVAVKFSITLSRTCSNTKLKNHWMCLKLLNTIIFVIWHGC